MRSTRSTGAARSPPGAGRLRGRRRSFPSRPSLPRCPGRVLDSAVVAARTATRSKGVLDQALSEALGHDFDVGQPKPDVATRNIGLLRTAGIRRS